LYSVSTPEKLPPDARITIAVEQDGAILATKTLHPGDPDFYTQFRAPRPGDAAIRIVVTAAPGSYTLQVNRWPRASNVRSGPIHRWQDAMEIKLGETVFASGDDAEYIPLPATSRRSTVEDPAGIDWYKFSFDSPQPKLVFFQIELTERDQLPVDLGVYRIVNGKPEGFFEGEDPVAFPHEVQAIPGNKFTPRVLRDKGDYYIAVRSSHPEYKLRTRLYDPPPYSDPQVAVRTALDYLLAAGDSWHANTPRRGGIFDRVSNVHQETSLCVACHPTHYTLRAQLYATRQGYPVVQRQQLQFLTERFYNNPRPFYGFEEQGVVWARMISAPAMVLSRMSHLISIYEDQVSQERRDSFHAGIANYLRLYYAGRDKLPPDETNGNTPLVSAHQVAWYAWNVTKDPKLGELISTGEVKNMIDLCYQTLALAEIDPARYREQVQKNAARILSLQRPSGQWAARFEDGQPEAEFQTGHALWALHAAGVPRTDPRVKKGLDYLLTRQQSFGAWMDPKQPYENFRTPFRESQMAVLALSAYFPASPRGRGWNSPKYTSLSDQPAELLDQLDNIWDPPSAGVRRQIESVAFESNDALLRQAAVEALGRLGVYDARLERLLGDPSKLVQRTAAWALRQSFSRHTDTPTAGLIAALDSSNDRTRWGATRIFAQHFFALAKRPELAAALERRIADHSIPVRMGAIKGLWQFWYWSPDASVKSGIEDAVLAAIAKPQPDWIASNLNDAIYNIADENIRYLYNNWTPLLARPEDSERAVRGRLAVESRLAAKFAQVLEGSNDLQKKALLRALVEFPLRRGDIYDLDADLGKSAPLVYSRVGNDTEQIAFFGASADRMAQAIAPLLDSHDAELRRLAVSASLLVRETRFGDVNRVAGPTGEPVRQLIAKLDRQPAASDVARQMKPAPPTPRTAGAARVVSTVKLDETYFHGYVEPILQRRGKDGYACVHCHSTHTLFDGTWGTVKNVVDTANPENSLILRKPTSSSESEGIVGAEVLPHGGGVRFSKESPEYSTILAWIKGAKE
jgi:hypothetical protein